MSKHKSETARINGSKSRGPITPEGKAKSSRNAVRHGLTANFSVLEHESQDDFTQLLDAYLDRYQPADPVELELVQTLAITRWRLRRIGNLESDLFGNQIVLSARDIDEEFSSIGDEGRLAYVFGKMATDGNALALLIRYESSLTRTYDRAAKQLDQLQNGPQRNEPTDPLTGDSTPTSPQPDEPDLSGCEKEGLTTLSPPENDTRHTPQSQRTERSVPLFRTRSSPSEASASLIDSATQFSDGFSARSITKISTGPLCDSNFNPSCS